MPPNSLWGKVADGQEGRQEFPESTSGGGQEVHREGEGEEGTAGTEGKGEQEEQGEGQERQELEVMSTVRPGGQPVPDGGRGQDYEEEGGDLVPGDTHCEREGISSRPGEHLEQWEGPGPWHCSNQYY